MCTEKIITKRGCFSNTVLSFDLLLPSGEIIHCSQEVNHPWFLATCGGMGLTGVILTVSLRLMPVRSAFIGKTLIRCKNLEEILTLFEANQAVPDSVAWIDCLGKQEGFRALYFDVGGTRRSRALVDAAA